MLQLPSFALLLPPPPPRLLSLEPGVCLRLLLVFPKIGPTVDQDLPVDFGLCHIRSPKSPT